MPYSLRLIILFFNVLFFFNAYGSSYSISPLKLKAKTTDKVLEFKLTNTSDQNIPLQIQIKKWTQKNNENIYSRTLKLIAIPTATTLKPRETQLFRVGILVPNKSKHIQAYRLFVRELPSELKEPTKKPETNIDSTNIKLHVLLDISIPVFIESHIPKKIDFNWEVHQKRNEKNYIVTLHNENNSVLKITNIDIYNHKNEKIFNKDLLVYILPYKKHYWVIKSTSPPKEIQAIINGETNKYHIQ